MEPVKTTKVGHNLLVTGSDKAAVEATARALAAKGAKVLSKVEPMGSNWVVTCDDPDDQLEQCEVVKLGAHLMVKGPTEHLVKAIVHELVQSGAKLVSPPSEATGGGWVAICDEAEDRRW